MAQENKFLSIPSQGGLFVPVRKGRGAQADDDDEDDEEEEEDARLLPRCSPVPRKRGHSLADETAEYMRIRLALPRRRVSFADASGGELVDVRQFVPFDSDEEDEDEARWEEEEAKYRKAYSRPTYLARADFQPLSGADLELAVRSRMLEVEGARKAPDEPLSFDVLVRVLNISFHKSVHVRATMDGWITYFDYPAEYVHGSSDGDSDGFWVRLSFAEPYLFHGARIDFVVRYETASGEFWANNEGKNYSVTLQVSYEEDTSQESSKVEEVELRGILKPPRHRMEDEYEFCQDEDEGGAATTEKEAAVVVPCVACPLVIEPEIDIEVSEDLSISRPTATGDAPLAECSLSIEYSCDKHSLKDLPAIPLHIDHPGTTGQATESLSPTKNLMTVSTDVEDSPKHNQYFPPNQDDFQLEISAQVPFDITSQAMYPHIQHEREIESVELKEETEAVEEIKSEIFGSETPMEVEERIPIYHKLQYAKMPECSECLSLKEPEKQTAKYDVEGATSRDKGAGLWIENAQKFGKEVPGMTVTHLGPTEDDIETQSLLSLPATSDPGVSVYRQQIKGQGPEPKEVVLADMFSASERTACKSLDILTSVCKSDSSPDFPAGVEALSLEGDERDIGTTEEMVTRKEFESFYEGLPPFQSQDDLESQLPLPARSLEVSSAQPEVALGQTLLLSFAFLIAAIFLVVGFQEPSVFIIGLVLVCLCL